MPSRDRNKLHPEVRKRLDALEVKAEERGIPFIVTQTDRTTIEQEAFWAQGREPLSLVNAKRAIASLPAITSKQNERTITNVRTSVHQLGFGFDVALKDQKGGVSWDTKADINHEGGPDYNELGKLGESLGLIWGGRFGFKDKVHFEWTGGLTLKELKAGHRPPESIVEDPIEKTATQKQEGDKMNPAMLAIGMTVLKGFVGVNNHETYEKGTGKERPIVLSRRVINGAVVAGTVAIAGWLGFDVPQADVTGVLDAGSAIVDTFKENKVLLVTAWSSVMTLIGHFKRKK